MTTIYSALRDMDDSSRSSSCFQQNKLQAMSGIVRNYVETLVAEIRDSVKKTDFCAAYLGRSQPESDIAALEAAKAGLKDPEELELLEGRLRDAGYGGGQRVYYRGELQGALPRMLDGLSALAGAPLWLCCSGPCMVQGCPRARL